MNINTKSTELGVAENVSLRKVVVSLSLPMLLSSLATSIANVGLPTLTQVFHASFQEAQWVVLAYLLAITTSAITVGRLGDIIDKRRLLKGGIGLFIVASLGCALAPTMTVLISARVLQGLGAAVMMTATLALVGEVISKEKTGRTMGMLGTISAIGTALGPSLGGMLIGGFGWPAMFLINIPFGLLALLLLSRYLPDTAPPSRPHHSGFDPVGILLLGLTLTLYALSMTLGQGTFGVLNGVLLLGSVIGAGVFVLLEQKVEFPLIQPAMLRHVSLRTGLITSALVTTIMMATLVVGPFYLLHALGLSTEGIGLAMSIGPMIAALGGVPAGYLVDRLGAQTMVTVGLAGITAGATVLSMISPIQGVFGYVAPVCLITAGYAIFQAANNTQVIKSVEAENRGVAAGMLNLSRNLGLITGASVMGAIFAFASATHDIQWATAADITAGMQFTYIVAALLGGVALSVATKFNR
ncbi:Major facilitator superfamily MFS_1 [Yersinia aldovae ATCC 35236]|uniref:Putative membrane transport protein n=1 Tax=Yersinia aldovae TaxID=29483 RepID=A0A0T9SZL0_YERAL|nr:MFS transporter [Yersinia aldovae]EEP96915.1 Major facilitator superfamily MFS_1 [Yersinia aldovae ATCC 35236]CNK52272.1 putative membrane transport protein [Yersinia aldovae]